MNNMAEPTRISVRRACWNADKPVLRHIRTQVFVQEQGVDQALEWDGQDADCTHVLAYAVHDIKRDAVGTGRLSHTGKIGRMAVLKAYRGQGIGGSILVALMDEARSEGLGSVYLHAQTHAQAFYQRFGFIAEGEEFLEAGIPHRKMRCDLHDGDGHETGEEREHPESSLRPR